MTGKRLFHKSIGGIISLAVLVCAFGYVSIANSIHNPFRFDGSIMLSESNAANFVGKSRQCSFMFVNTSEKSVKLVKIKLQGYSGIQIGRLEVNGNTVSGQLIRTDRKVSGVQMSDHTVTYLAKVENSTVHNPTSVLITYTYLGWKHTQTLNLS